MSGLWTCLFWVRLYKFELLIGSAAALEGITLSIAGCLCIGTIYLDRGSSTFAVIIIGTVVSFAVNLNLFTSTAICETVSHGTSGTLLKTSAACFICTCSVLACYIDFTFGTELIFVVDTFDC